MVSRETSIREAVERAAEKLQYSPLKAEQARAIEGFMEGLDVFVILPTGYGKKVCYSCLPLASDIYHSVTGLIILVVSPLIALIADQISALTSFSWYTGISRSFLHLPTRSSELKKTILYLPSLISEMESLSISRVMKAADIPLLVGLVIDEAYCVLKW